MDTLRIDSAHPVDSQAEPMDSNALIAKVEAVLTEPSPSPDELSTLIGSVIGEDPLEDDHESKGHILALRKAGKMDLLLEMAQKLEDSLVNVPPQDRDFISVYKKMAAKAREMHEEVMDIEQRDVSQERIRWFQWNAANNTMNLADDIFRNKPR